MPRYAFDLQDGELQRDEEGFDCANIDAAREKVMASLPDVAELIISNDRDNQTVTVLVHDEAGGRIDSGTLTSAGLMLNGRAPR